MNRYKFAFAVLAICATITMLAVPVITTTEARTLLPAKVVLFKSATESPRLATVATGALIDGLSAGAMAVLAANPVVQIDIYSGSKLIRAYTGAAAIGDGEDLGSELTPNSTAVSDSRTEANATTGWSESGTGTFTSVSVAPNVGSYNFEINTTINKRIWFDATVTVGGLYKNSVDVKKVTGTNGQHRMYGDAGTTEIATANLFTNTSWATSTLYGTAITTTIRVWPNPAVNPSVVEIDNHRLQPVTGPSTSGALLYNSAAMTVQSVLVNTFDATAYAAATKTVIISKLK